MAVTERQSRILEKIIEEYIKLARPVSSQILERTGDLGISPATIRIEMQKLTDEGYIYQPHISAGRVPTDKGYRYVVDRIMKNLGDKNAFEGRLLDKFKEIEKKNYDVLKFVQFVTELLSSISSSLSLVYLFERDFIWGSGWKEVFQEPEFQDFTYSFRFVKMIDNLERNANSFILRLSSSELGGGNKQFELEDLYSDYLSGLRVYIGEENPIHLAKDFSIIIARCSLPETKNGGVMAILGPKRMAYDKNINLINSVAEILKDY